MLWLHSCFVSYINRHKERTELAFLKMRFAIELNSSHGTFSSIPIELKTDGQCAQLQSLDLIWCELFIRFIARVFRKLLSIYVFNYFPFSFEGRRWDLIVSVPDHCLSFYFVCSNCVWFLCSQRHLVSGSIHLLPRVEAPKY